MRHTCLILLFIPTLGFSQMRERLSSTDLKRYGQNGKVMEVIHKRYEPRFSTDSRYTLELYDMLIAHNFKLEFKKDGNLKTKTELRKEGDSLKARAVWNYKYDRENRIAQEMRISFSKYSRDTITWNYEYVGDTITNIKQLEDTDKASYYTYRQSGNKEYLNQANADSSYLGQRVFFYDKQNRFIRSEDYANKDLIQDLRLLTYRDTISKNRFKEIRIRTEDNSNSYKEFEYDENGNVITMTSGSFSNDQKSVNRYEYVYDKNGNWIEQRHFGPDENLFAVFKREIRYYE